uniref:Uncharacterized protein n=1 Tax=Candidatus Kentrum sp. FW TaxID=2126338 RepID=A0A450TXX6_9GAMM|nr:MAG: hypothetical protein BECKFW1821C_GA0114237_10587 [Candidatus Kentron sp. FW]
MLPSPLANPYDTHLKTLWFALMLSELSILTVANYADLRIRVFRM